MPVWWTQSRDRAPFLIDEHRCLAIAYAVAQRTNKFSQLIAIGNVAAEKNESPRSRLSKELLFLGIQFRSKTAENHTVTHVKSRRYLSCNDAAAALGFQLFA